MQTYDSETGLVVLTVSLDDLNKVLKTMDKQAKRMNQRLERLTKAGDELYDAWIGYYGEQILDDHNNGTGEICRTWNAAKEGKGQP